MRDKIVLGFFIIMLLILIYLTWDLLGQWIVGGVCP